MFPHARMKRYLAYIGRGCLDRSQGPRPRARRRVRCKTQASAACGAAIAPTLWRPSLYYISLHSAAEKILEIAELVPFHRQAIFLLLRWQDRIMWLMREVGGN
jgi:hypothetical protein